MPSHRQSLLLVSGRGLANHIRAWDAISKACRVTFLERTPEKGMGLLLSVFAGDLANIQEAGKVIKELSGRNGFEAEAMVLNSVDMREVPIHLY